MLLNILFYFALLITIKELHNQNNPGTTTAGARDDYIDRGDFPPNPLTSNFRNQSTLQNQDQYAPFAKAKDADKHDIIRAEFKAFNVALENAYNACCNKVPLYDIEKNKASEYFKDLYILRTPHGSGGSLGGNTSTKCALFFNQELLKIMDTMQEQMSIYKKKYQQNELIIQSLNKHPSVKQFFGDNSETPFRIDNRNEDMYKTYLFKVAKEKETKLLTNDESQPKAYRNFEVRYGRLFAMFDVKEVNSVSEDVKLLSVHDDEKQTE